jgi:hypothetical protein
MVRVTSTGFQNQPSKFYTWVVGATVPRGRISGPGDKRGSPVKAKNVLTSSELPDPFLYDLHTYIHRSDRRQAYWRIIISKII